MYLDFDLDFNKHHLHYIFLSVLEVSAFGEKDVLFGRLFSSEGRGEMGKTVRRQQSLTAEEGQQSSITVAAWKETLLRPVELVHC